MNTPDIRPQCEVHCFALSQSFMYAQLCFKDFDCIEKALNTTPLYILIATKKTHYG